MTVGVKRRSVLRAAALAIMSCPLAADSAPKEPSGVGFAVPLPGGRPGQTPQSWRADIDLLASGHMGWVRCGVPYWRVAPDGDTTHIKWDEEAAEELRAALQYATDRGLRIYLSAGAPDWAVEFGRVGYRRVAENFWEGLADRLGGLPSVWQVFNEADASHYSTHRPLHPDRAYLRELASLLVAARERLGARSSGVPLITTNLSGWPMNNMTQAYWNRILDQLAPDLDLLTVDVYPQDNWDEIERLPERVEQLCARYGKPVGVAEFGLQTGGKPSRQRDALVGIVDALRQARPTLVIGYELRDPPPGVEFPDFGLYTHDSRAKAAAAPVLRTMRTLRY